MTYVTCQIPMSSSSTEEIECSYESSALKTCSCTETCESEYGSPGDRFDYTLAIIKPEGMAYRREIESMIAEREFTILQTRWVKLTPEQVSDFYQDKYKKDDFGLKVIHLSSSPVLVFVLSKMNAVQEWKYLMGPSKVSFHFVVSSI